MFEITPEKMKIPSLFKSKRESRHPWQKWPSCKHPKTVSFRAAGDEEMLKTASSILFYDAIMEGAGTPESLFTNSSETTSFSTDSDGTDGRSLEMVARAVRSERLFYEPDDTSSILGEAKACGTFPFKDSVAVAVETADPYGDFKRSMEEMIERHGLNGWNCLEEMLAWYLRVNDRCTHGLIVGAFVDILLEIASNATSETSCSSALSYLSSFPERSDET